MTTVNRKFYEQIPPGVYRATFTGVKDLGFQSTAWGEKELVELTFTTGYSSPTTGQPVPITARCSKSLHPKARLNAIVSALLNGPVPDSIEIEQLFGRAVQLIVKLAPSKDGTRSWSRIDSVLPAPPLPPPAYQAPAPVYYPPQPPAPAQSFSIPAPVTETRQ
jgi:hypothetical protein